MQGLYQYCPVQTVYIEVKGTSWLDAILYPPVTALVLLLSADVDRLRGQQMMLEEAVSESSANEEGRRIYCHLFADHLFSPPSPIMKFQNCLCLDFPGE